MELLYVNWNFDPVAFSILGVEIAWYGLMWVSAFVMGMWLMTKMVNREGLNPDITSSSAMYCMVATIVGARLGHCLFYDPAFYFSHPWEILMFRHGGMASHGAALGLLVGIWLFSRKWKMPYIWLLDRIGVFVAIGGAIIRIGNLFNSEVYGAPTTLPWGFVFLRNGETFASHPTQIYEAGAYLVLFAILAHMYWRTQISNRRGVMFGVFLIGLFTSRFLIECIKNVQEISEITLVETIGLNMGQLLSIPFIIAGVVILVIALRRPAQPYENLPQPPKEDRAQKRRSTHGK